MRAVEDPELVAHLVAHRIPLEVCPTSNLRTGVATSWEEHQVLRLLDAGATVTISTDDPTLFHCDLAGELQRIAELTAGGPAIVHRLTETAIDSSWMTPGERAEMRMIVDGWWPSAEAGATGDRAKSPRR